jgi:uncharacterized protein (DUF2252 family)
MARKSVDERHEEGREARRSVPRSAHAHWRPAPDRPDPIGLLQEQNDQRVPWLVPVRHARMRESPFTFYRGTASIMASDLAGTPTSGFDVQTVGDGHLSNFGAYASPERQLDFDETLNGPWEWDVKRLATSFLIAARHREFPEDDAHAITLRVVKSYRDAMADYGEKGFLELWYEHTGMEQIGRIGRGEFDKHEVAKRLAEFERRARSKNSLQALDKLTVRDGDRFRIRTDRPVLVPISELKPDRNPAKLEQIVRETFDDYVATLRDDRRGLLERYELVDVALRVVGVGSVGTRCFVLLLEGRDWHDPLLLQVKEANASVLEPHLHGSRYPHHGQRVVAGQRQIQAQSDIFLGWATGSDEGRHYYGRQLRDWKRSVDIDSTTPRLLDFYARLCGQILARGHARSGDPVAIAGYVGTSKKLDEAILEFARTYADQTVEDYERFREAIADGTLPVGDET